MLLCPRCNVRFEDNVRNCPHDGRRLLPGPVVSAGGGDTLLGATLAGRYTIVGRVGSGGMGTVYRAEQAPMNREIALKVLRRDLGRDPETVARFHREARTLSQLKHPNTVTIFDFGQTEDELLYLAMELLEGEMLSSRLKRLGTLEVPLAIKIAAGVLRSLGEAHIRGIIHRDLKPDNIFLAKVHGRPDEDEIVKVVDFGIAKIRDGERGIEPLQTQEGTVFGTPRYMSPEQAQGKTLDGRSDLYAVGVLLFHMLVGRAPFTDDDAVVVMAHHIKTIPEPVRAAAPGRPIPASLEALVAQSLEKDPIDRPQTAEAFLIELERVLVEARAMAVTTLRPTMGPPSPLQHSRRVVWISACSLALLAVVAGLAAAAPRSTARRGNVPQNGTRASANHTSTRPAIPIASQNTLVAPTALGTAPALPLVHPSDPESMTFDALPEPVQQPTATATYRASRTSAARGHRTGPSQHAAAHSEPRHAHREPAARTHTEPGPQPYHRWSD